MSDAAASGGYYMAMTGDAVIAYPGTFTGSIGVVFAKPNLHGLYDKLGITKSTSSGAGSPTRIPTTSRSHRKSAPSCARASTRTIATQTKVAEGRRKKFDEIEPLAQGRVGSARSAGARPGGRAGRARPPSSW
jgi:protease-4